jgi:Calx-beta domain-containing protein
MLRFVVPFVAVLVFAPGAAGTIPPSRDPVPALSIGDVTTVETNVDIVAVLDVSLSAPTDDAVTVHWATADGAADSTDYVQDSGTLTFVPRQTTAHIAIMIKGDALDEPGETVFVDLSDAYYATIERARGTITILDDPADRPALRVVDAAVEAKWSVHRGYTRVVLLQVRRAPDGATIEIACAGAGCPLREKPSGPNVTALRAAKLRPGTRVQVRVDVSGMIGRVFEYTMRASKTPRLRTLCFPPAASKPAPC